MIVGWAVRDEDVSVDVDGGEERGVIGGGRGEVIRTENTKGRAGGSGEGDLAVDEVMAVGFE